MQHNSSHIEPEALNAELARKTGILILDVRTRAEFASEHIPGSTNIPLAELPGNLSQLSQAQPTVVVCRTGRRATTAAQLLETNGIAARILVGGVSAWRQKNFPTVEGKKCLPLDQQVQLIAGSLVLAGTLLGIFVQKWWLILPAFVGAGLTYAGLSGNCGLAILLSRAPWNKDGPSKSSCSP